MGTRDQLRRLGASLTMPLSNSTAPGAPAPTAISRSCASPASFIRPRSASARRESSVSGAIREGVAITSCASGSPRRSATASRVRVGPRSMAPMHPWRALNSMNAGRRPPRDGPAPRSRTTPLRIRSMTRLPTVGAESPVASISSARVNGLDPSITADSTRSRFCRRRCPALPPWTSTRRVIIYSGGGSNESRRRKPRVRMAP
jgi:hypothetical protein